jgi:23S rRNA A2030 N6-methylase RlmJ
MAYDHHSKAGNEGDVVKHPALIAALNCILGNQTKNEQTKGKPFHYLDCFSGHAWHPLLDEDSVTGIQKKFEWSKGIGLLHEKLFCKTPSTNKYVKMWRDMYLSSARDIVRGWYPGSPTIAADMCKKHDRPIRMTLFDISDEAQADLRKFFCPIMPTDLTRNDWCVIGRSLNPTEVKEEAICEPDFVFIDPPGFGDKDGYPNWRPYFKHVLGPRAPLDINQKLHPTLMWLPFSRNIKSVKTESDWDKLDGYKIKRKPANTKQNVGLFQQIKECRYLDYEWTAVHWSNGGCILIYNCAKTEIQAAVECVVKIANSVNPNQQRWDVKHS